VEILSIWTFSGSFMPKFESVQSLARPLGEVFDFFCRPANFIQVMPPELHLRFVEGPELLELGARFVVQGKRWGVPQRIVSEVTVFEPEVRFIDEQREGPFRKWIHTHRFEASGGTTRVQDVIDYEPPGGLLGMMVTANMIERDLKWVFEYRVRKLADLFGGTM
jgi:ligand-binding SRPBCC domain-containing protein